MCDAEERALPQTWGVGGSGGEAVVEGERVVKGKGIALNTWGVGGSGG